MSQPTPLPTQLQGHKLVGPFPSTMSPTNGDGLYGRISPKTGDIVFAYYSRRDGWAKYASCPERAMELRHKRSKCRATNWYGFEKSPAKAR